VGAAQLAAILEVAPSKSASRWSKCRVGDMDEDSLMQASKFKAQRTERDNSCDPLNYITDLRMQTNLGDVGITLGQDNCSIEASLTS
jgi:hypothetical protein